MHIKHIKYIRFVHRKNETVTKIIKIIYIILFIYGSLYLQSCKKFVEIEPPNNQIVSASVYQNDLTATAVIRGIYSQMISGGFASGNIQSVTYLGGLSSDELTNYSTAINPIEFYSNSLSPTNSNIQSDIWQDAYNHISNANAIIEGLTNSTGVTINTKNDLLGEAKFIRAFCHFYLVNLFGNVPLITSTNYELNKIATRSPIAKVYQQIIADLNDAQNLLVSDFSFSNGERNQPNKWAASALLARVYLYYGDWANAETLSTILINNKSTYSLVSNLNNVFLKNSTETIWQLKPVITTINTYEGADFILKSIPVNAALSNQLINTFEPNDNRKLNWVSSYSDGVQTYYFPYKYKVQSSSTLTEYSMVLRLAEQYLIRAEARAQQNNITGSEADLNVIRTRAGLGNTNATTQIELLTAIEHERQVELFTEWGHRWLDLKRTNRADAILKQIKNPNWKSTSVLYPIPLSEILIDGNLTQNVGY